MEVIVQPHLGLGAVFVLHTPRFHRGLSMVIPRWGISYNSLSPYLLQSALADGKKKKNKNRL